MVVYGNKKLYLIVTTSSNNDKPPPPTGRALVYKDRTSAFFSRQN